MKFLAHNKCLIKGGYHDWCQVSPSLWTEEWGCYLGQLLQTEIMNDQNEPWVCGLQIIFANLLLPSSSKFPITKHFLEYFIKFLYDFRNVFHRGSSVYNQQYLLPSTKERVTWRKILKAKWCYLWVLRLSVLFYFLRMSSANLTMVSHSPRGCVPVMMQTYNFRS